MSRFVAILLLVSATGCSGFATPTPEELSRLGLYDPASRGPDYARCRIHLNIDSPWLSGEFDGVVIARYGEGVRTQLFGDLGPKMLDLSARPDRIVGYFPQTLGAVDCALPGEAAPHPLLFMGASLMENFTRVSRDRVVGIRPEGDGRWLKLRPSVNGLEVQLFVDRKGAWTKRRYRWIYGVSWEEEWNGSVCRITAPQVLIRLTVHDQEFDHLKNPAALQLTLPADARIVQGSRK